MTVFVLPRPARRKTIATLSAATLVSGLLLAGPLATAAHATPSTFVVNTTGNASDLATNGSCDTAATAGLQCTLRAAIQEANANAGPDTIQFAMASPYRITLNATGLPQITSPVLIDGTSQTGFSPSTGVIVRVDGVSNTTGLSYGFDVQSGGGGTTIKGLEIDRFSYAGIRLSANGNMVTGNYVGSTAADTVNCATGVSCGNYVGVQIQDASSNVVGGTTAGDRNVISNNYYGVQVTTSAGASTGNTIQGNYLGTNVAGTASVGNYYAGVYVDNEGGSNPANTTIGGTAAGAGNLVSGNTNQGVEIDAANGVSVVGNIIGLNASGTGKVANSTGVYVGGSTATTVGGSTAAARNLISGNSNTGVYVYDDSGTATSPVTVQGNYVGTDVTGTLDRGNGSLGISVSTYNPVSVDANVVAGNDSNQIEFDYSRGGSVTNNLVGVAVDGSTSLSSTSGDGIGSYATTDSLISANTSSGNECNGINLQSTDSITVTDNLLGTNSAGSAAVANGCSGLYGSGVTDSAIGTAGHGNVLSGNSAYGIELTGARDSSVQGNLVGTNSAGTVAISNAQTGVYLASSNRIAVGGTASGAGNVIARNGVNCCEGGLYLGSSDDNTILGNRVGVGSDGSALGNKWVGVYVDGSSDGNQIGSAAPGGGNIVSNNAVAGVVVDSNGLSNQIRGNSITANTGLGIDLANDGVTANDTGDTDFGANRLQNYPVLSTSASNVNGTEITGTLNSRANRQYTLDFYANTACDSSGNGEGANYLGSTTVTTGAGGNASFRTAVPGVAPTASLVTATATDALLGDTSEFSTCLANQGGLPSVSVANASAAENAGNLSFTVSLSSAPVFTPVTVDYATSDGTATSPTDYTATTGTVTFGVGETSKQVLVPIVDDSLDENDETLTLTLSNPVNTIIQPGQGTATGTIQDDDAPPTVSIANAIAVNEPDTPNTVNQTFQVSLSAPSALPITVVAHTTPGTATENADYQGTAAVISFAPGQTTGTFTVVVNGDNTDEFNETYNANLVSPTNATVGTGTASAVITDNDPPPSLSVGDVSMLEGTTGVSTTFLFAVTLSQPSEKNVHVVLSTANGTAKVTDADYKPKSNSALNIGPGVTSKNFKVTVVGDTKVEPNETFFVNVVTGATTNCTVLDGQGQGTILNDD